MNRELSLKNFPMILYVLSAELEKIISVKNKGR